MNSEITGRLEGWWYDKANHVIWGYMYNDARKRFSDGAYIHTSNLRLPKTTVFYEGMEVPTLNSTYLLGTPFEG